MANSFHRKETSMNKALPNIKEDISQLEQMLKTEKDARLKERIHALYLFGSKQAKNRTSVANMLSEHRTTIGTWLKTYENKGMTGLLTIETHPNEKSSIPPDVLEELKAKLEDPEGFKGYKLIQNMDRRTVWYRYSIQDITWYNPLPSESQNQGWQKVTYKKNEQEGIEFLSNLRTILSFIASSLPFDGNIRVFSQDESRFGLLPVQRQIITLKGTKPIFHVRHEFETYYLYGAVEPIY